MQSLNMPLQATLSLEGRKGACAKHALSCMAAAESCCCSWKYRC